MSWYALPANVPWLTLAVVIPLSGALLVALTPAVARRVIKQLGVLASVITLALVLVIIGGFQQGVGNLHLQFEELRQWVPAVGISYHLGVDGLSLFLLGLNALLFLIAVLVTSSAAPRLKQFILLLLILEAATAGILLSLDLILFYVFWEAMLVPLYFLIGVWGEGQRVYAAFKFLIYTVFGSFAMLVAILAVAAITFAQTGQLSFDWTVLVQHPASGVWHLPLNLGEIGIPQLLFLGFALAFAIKMPLFPLHTWLPAAYTASPIPVVIVFAGLVSKLGAYGFLRFNLSLFPDAAHSLGPALAVLATTGILYGAFMALVQTDLKRLVAYASMSHLGFIGLGIFAGNLLGIEGALVQMVNHGVIIAALFLIVGMIERRSGTRDRAQLRGLGASAPAFAALFLVISLAALGLPGLNGFTGEFLIMLGAWTAFVPMAVGAGIGVILAAWYVLRFYQGSFQEAPPQPAGFGEMRVADAGVLAPLLALMIVIGVSPAFFPAAVEATVKALPVLLR
ncbi:MAG: NADH-quinone oxidoreductase subunit M [Chloroflexi bacterium]|nr:MAG: NADH-quinone oxidoreductase subunit M [Chloroflexota bacterium]TMF22342.1 MAG: NADH-quinone oxidoreductase subunit M [Chloroflexota bacterium]TMG20367.1 MAG: NADH-quinone oxidoreductase subunit M [Chloroflexota bacterium]